jgi:CubicO group peptidase (beta-lactamase class C family)
MSGGSLQAVLDGTVGKVPGLSAAVVREGEVVWIGASGLADVARQVAAAPGTVYLWFSMTKIATATAVVQLAERGLLELDEPVKHHVPQFPSEAVTIRHLLSHSSGLSNPVPVRWIHPAEAAAPDPHAFALGQLARHGKLKGTPGARASYSNLGYVVLGEVVASASGQSYERYVRDQLLAALGMARTDFRYRDDLAAHAATAYQLRWSPLTPLYRLMLPKGIVGPKQGRFVSFNRFCVDGASYGGLIGSVEDAARFLTLHTSGGAVGAGSVLSPESVASMQKVTATGPKLDVGLGWFRRHSDRKLSVPYLEHLGGGGGFFNMMRLFPDQKLGVVVMGNATSYDHQRIAAAVVEQFGR